MTRLQGFGAGGPETSATHACYVRLRQMILTGALPPGGKLKIEDLRGRLGIGASPVREALSLLTSDLLVERLDQRGFRAAPVSRENFEEILLLRCALEAEAARLSLAAPGEGWEARLAAAHAEMSAAEGTGGFEAAHKAFHMAILSGAGLPMLLRYCAQLYDLNIRYRYLAADAPLYGERSIAAEHAAILEAALARDADETVRLLTHHYRTTGAYLSRWMEERA